MQNSHLIRELEEAIDNDSLVIFCGSGTSSNLELPSWKDLVLKIIRQISYHNPPYSPLADLLLDDILDPLAILDILEEEFKRTITETLQREIEIDKRRECTLQEKILKLSERIITTNYDKAFENASNTPNVILNDGKFKLAKIADNQKFIFKIHGDIDNPEDCILFTSQYKKLYQESAFLLGLKILFIQKTILFVGFSLNDPYIIEILNTITNAFDSFNSRHFIVTTDSKFCTEKFNRKIRAHVLKDYSELDVFLDSLINYKNNSKKHFAPVHNLSDEHSNWEIWNSEHLDEIVQRILRTQPVTVITGDHGSGKTSLARELALLCLGKSKVKIKNALSFEFVVWLSISQCNNPKKILNTLFEEIGRVTGYTKLTYISEDDLSFKEKEVAQILKNLKVLIVIDNYHLSKDDSLEAWMQKIHPPSEILLTSLYKPNFRHNGFNLVGLKRDRFKGVFINEAKNRGINVKEYKGDSPLDGIYKLTLGNPQAILLVLGIIRKTGGFKDFWTDKGENTNALEYLYKYSYAMLKDSSKDLLPYIALFNEKTLIEIDALKAICQVDWTTFNNALEDLKNFHLLDVDHEDKYCNAHPTFVSYIEKKLQDKNSSKRAKERYIDYYLLVVENIKRVDPPDDYWNSLVSDRMEAVDPHFSSIVKALEWASKEKYIDKLVSFAMCLVHYLDSRLYNQIRIKLVNDALEATTDAYLQAIFHIDALSWTFVEEGDLVKAKASILTGRAIADTINDLEQRTELLCLADAWLARVEVEQKVNTTDNQLIDSALEYIGKPWIKYRIYMAAGDIYFKINEKKKSLEYYQSAKDEIRNYGGEGGNYQINPRLGLAYLRVKGESYLIEAEKMFQSLARSHKASMGKLYGEFGLAMVKYIREGQSVSKEQVARLESEISKKSPNNILLKLIQQCKAEIFAAGIG